MANGRKPSFVGYIDTRKKETPIMAGLPYATSAQFGELMRQSGFPENTPQTNAFSILAHAPAVGAPALQLVFALLTETDVDPRVRELVILRVAQRSPGPFVWVQHVAIARAVGVSDAKIAALEQGEVPTGLFVPRERAALAFADEIVDTSRSPLTIRLQRCASCFRRGRWWNCCY
jgi:alkylhydroperoxidase family enzyme